MPLVLFENDYCKICVNSSHFDFIFDYFYQRSVNGFFLDNLLKCSFHFGSLP